MPHTMQDHDQQMEYGLQIRASGVCFIAIGAVVLSGAVFPFMKGKPEFAFLHPHLLYQGFVAFIALLGVYLLLPVWREVAARFMAAPLLVLLIVWMLVSQIWTFAPQARLPVIVAFATSTIFGAVLAVAVPRRNVLRILALTALVIMAVSLVYTYVLQETMFAWPGLKRMAGIYSNKNLLVRIAVMASCIAAFLLVWPGGQDDERDSSLHKAAWILVLLAGIWMVTQYYSFTAKVAVAAAIGAVVLARAGAVNHRWFYATGLLFLFGAGLSIYYMDEILAAARETSGLKNRMFHWGLMLNQESVPRWTGAGLGGFWDRATGPWKELALLTPLRHGHSGFIDTWLDLGYVGLLLVVGNMLFMMIRTLRKPFASWSWETYFATALFVIFVTYNVAESSILPTNSANTFLWAVFVALALGPVIQEKTTD